MELRIIFVSLLSLLVARVGCGETSKMENNGAEVHLMVYHYKVPCTGESAQLCYKIKYEGQEPEAFYDAIEGFDFEWGYNYTISVEKKSRANTPADASSFTYTLKKVLKKEKVPATETFELPLQTDGQPFVENNGGACRLVDRIIDVGSFSCDALQNAQRGVFRHDAFRSGLVLVSLK